MTDDNIIGIDGRQAAQLRTEQAEREQREQILRQKLKCEGLELRPGNAPGSYTIAHPHPSQPPCLNGWCDLPLVTCRIREIAREADNPTPIRW
jgi:hypothetical protein